MSLVTRMFNREWENHTIVWPRRSRRTSRRRTVNELFRLTPMDDDSNELHHYLNGENRRGPPNLFCVWIKRDLREYINRGVDVQWWETPNKLETGESKILEHSRWNGGRDTSTEDTGSDTFSFLNNKRDKTLSRLFRKGIHKTVHQVNLPGHVVWGYSVDCRVKVKPVEVLCCPRCY